MSDSQRDIPKIPSRKHCDANPAPLGLLAFGFTTAMLNFRNAHIIPQTGSQAVIFSLGIFYAIGGLAQVLAGIFEFIKSNDFGLAAFTSYGFFWISLVFLENVEFLLGIEPVDNASLATYLFIWGIITTGFFITIWRKNFVIMMLFFSLAILFFILASGIIATYYGAPGGETMIWIGGYIGLVVAAIAFYLGFAELNGWPVGVEIVRTGRFWPPNNISTSSSYSPITPFHKKRTDQIERKVESENENENEMKDVKEEEKEVVSEQDISPQPPNFPLPVTIEG